MIILSVQTEHFYFEAIDRTAHDAHAVLREALRYHGETHGLPANWHLSYDIDERCIQPGECHRDGQLLFKRTSKP